MEGHGLVANEVTYFSRETQGFITARTSYLHRDLEKVTFGISVIIPRT